MPRACQLQVRLGAMSSAGEDAEFAANGRVISFPGFLRAYVEGSDDPEAELEDREVRLPRLAVGDSLAVEELQPGGPHDSTAGPVHRGFTGEGARRNGRRAAVDVCHHPRHHPEPRLRLEKRDRPGAVLDRVCRGGRCSNSTLPSWSTMASRPKWKRTSTRSPAGTRSRCRGSPAFISVRRGRRTTAPGLKQMVAERLADIDARAVNSIPIGGAESRRRRAGRSVRALCAGGRERSVAARGPGA